MCQVFKFWWCGHNCRWYWVRCIINSNYYAGFCGPSYSRPHVWSLNECGVPTSQVRQGVLGSVWQHAVLLQGPLALVSSTKYKPFAEQRLTAVCAVDLGSMMTMWFLPIHNMPPETDSALNSSLRHVSMHERHATSVWLVLTIYLCNFRQKYWEMLHLT